MTQKPSNRYNSPPEWLPDWRIGELYPNPYHTSGIIWAWEFLRRNPDYQDEHEHQDKLKKDPSLEASGILDNQDILRHAHQGSPFAIPGETVEEYITRNSNQNWELTNLSQAVAKKFGMDTSKPPHPSEDFSCNESYILGIFDNPLETTVIGGSPKHRCYEVEYSVNLNPNEVALTFDLALPISQQLRQAQSLLDLLQNEIKKNGAIENEKRPNKNKKLQEYLRILDGRQTGATFRDIGQTLWPHKDPEDAGDNAKKNEQKALALRNGGYQRLPLLDFPS